jgi:hypothetical protein
MPQSLLTGQLKKKPTYRVWCLYSSIVSALCTVQVSGTRYLFIYSTKSLVNPCLHALLLHKFVLSLTSYCAFMHCRCTNLHCNICILCDVHCASMHLRCTNLNYNYVHIVHTCISPAQMCTLIIHILCIHDTWRVVAL